MRAAFPQAEAAVDANGTPIVNLANWTEFYTRIKDILRYKPPDLSSYRQKAGVVSYLESQLNSISTTDEDLEKMSVSLRAKEDLLEQLAIDRFNYTGIS